MFLVRIPVVIHVTLHACCEVSPACGSDLVKQPSKALCQFLFGPALSYKSSKLCPLGRQV